MDSLWISILISRKHISIIISMISVMMMLSISWMVLKLMSSMKIYILKVWLNLNITIG